MNNGLGKLLFVLLMSTASVAYAGDWNLVKNVKRLEQIAPDYKDDTAIDKKFLEVLDLTEKTRKDAEVYDEAKRISAMPALMQSKYMDSFQYYMMVKATTLSKAASAEADYWLGLLKANNKSPHLLAAWLVHIKQLPKNSPDIRRNTQLLVDWIKAQKPEMKVRAPEYTGNMIMGYKPRTDFVDGEYLKLYTLSYYKATVTPPAGFFEEDIYINLLDRIKERHEDTLTEMAGIYRKMGKRKEASDVVFQLAALKIKAKDFQNAKTLLDDAVKLNPENLPATKERDRIKLELTYQSLSPAATAPQAKPEEPLPTTELLVKTEGYLTPQDRIITAAELQGKSKEELRVMRNEVFARHGKIFQNPDLSSYFTRKSWYTQDQKYSDSQLTETDKENIRIIQEQENSAK